MKAYEYALKVKAHIDTPDKWHKGDFHGTNANGGECHCVVGAMLIVDDEYKATHGYSNVSGYHLINLSSKFAAEALRHTGPDGIRQGLSPFNDDPATTHADMMEVLDKTHVRLKELDL